jgi:hypothetical protein
MTPSRSRRRSTTRSPSCSSKGRVENYPWLYPPPLLHQWKGYRQYAKLGETNYRVPNMTYTAEFEALLEDLDDDQVGGFKLQAAAMAKGAKKWRASRVPREPGRRPDDRLLRRHQLFRVVAHGRHRQQHRHRHHLGLRRQSRTRWSSLVTANKLVKPLLWQDRDGPDFKTDAGSHRRPEGPQGEVVERPAGRARRSASGGTRSS